jgi:hypothetical protein
MGCLVPMKKKAYKEQMHHFRKIAYYYMVILNLQNQAHKIKRNWKEKDRKPPKES